ncbi:ribonuclease R family protein [Synoicihabitans lomoniglobus]|uniref:Ribonuclease R n=1 Tax=Synoicihabitans lomoniglobus TaxID=2909285 RepID=A0AAF0I840_9BACT|nr:RNB domain-containing ribonuclease [Opitutaceae bacterium LMO-M01]WED67291.1 RNB domain-containing ribonuclease [Opitutaceae bacterium LMO-M01]
MKFSKSLLQHVSAAAYRPVNETELGRQIGINKKQRRLFSHEVRLLLASGELKLVAGDKITAPHAAGGGHGDGTLTGKLRFRTGGSAMVIIDRAAHPDAPEVVQIAAEDAANGFNGDVVRIQLDTRPNQRRNARKPRGDEPRGRVTEIIDRGTDIVVGTLRRVRKRYYVSPDDPKFVHDIAVEDPADAKLSPAPDEGDKVVVRLQEWTNTTRAPDGRIIERLGRQWEAQAEMLGVFRKFNLDPKFPANVQAEVAALPDHVMPRDLTARLDYRKIPTFTIDPDDAKDFDDALSIEFLPDDQIKIGIHIADVSAYVKPGTELDKEAQTRGNSTYLVGTVIPMLPEKLSNGLCSLVEAQDRLTKAVFLTFDKKRRVISSAYANTVIRSRKRLTYKQAYTLLKEDDLQAARDLPLPPKHQTGSTGRALKSLTDKELGDLQSWVRTLWSLASKLRRDRMNRGSLDLDMPETKVFVDEFGYAERLELIEHDESHQLIEEFMLAANEAVAHLTKKHKLPSVYRVHDDPDDEKLGELRQHLATFGIKVGDLTNREEVTKLLRLLRTHPQGHVLRTSLLRSLKKAAYRASPDGHYGLCKGDYTHFTSPIRRYADLVVHRIIDHYLITQGGWPMPAGYKFNYTQEKAERLGEHLSITETNSQEAERESVKIKTLEFFERDLAKREPTTFPAIITDVRQHGLFIELEQSMTFGFLPTHALGDDYYSLTDDNTAMIGRKTKKRYELNGRIPVQVAKVDRVKRMIDFKLAADSQSETSPAEGIATTLQHRPHPKSKQGTKPKQRPGAQAHRKGPRKPGGKRRR